MESKIKVAAAHAAPVFMDKKATTRKVVSLIEQAGKEGIKFLVFPETFIPGFPVNRSLTTPFPPYQSLLGINKTQHLVLHQLLPAPRTNHRPDQVCRAKRGRRRLQRRNRLDPHRLSRRQRRHQSGHF